VTIFTDRWGLGFGSWSGVQGLNVAGFSKDLAFVRKLQIATQMATQTETKTWVVLSVGHIYIDCYNDSMIPPQSGGKFLCCPIAYCTSRYSTGCSFSPLLCDQTPKQAKYNSLFALSPDKRFPRPRDRTLLVNKLGLLLHTEGHLRGELSKLVSNHVFRDGHVVVDLPIVHRKLQSDEAGEYCCRASLCPNWLDPFTRGGTDDG
jgi:hypothetical protein